MATEVAKSLKQESDVTISDLNDRFATVAEFATWLKIQSNHTDHRFEFIDGKVINKGGVRQTEVFMHSFLQDKFYRTTTSTATGFLATNCEIPISKNKRFLSSLAYFNAAQLRVIKMGNTLVPQFIIEIERGEMLVRAKHRKIQDYFEADAQLVWYINPEQQLIYAYTAPHEIMIYHGEREISAAPVVTDFKFKVNELFS